ncbi:tripartite tricarboxylate transporter substrate binding protein [Belnapia sp. T6]|uniref:Tripartite tricarboxylate transporter substrate binding protein n=1 Tax=Belnapia mucosa TaxID=2804532 RepID=A0ABS1V7N8_9PROT|nr:tripartite tricarboxylate transporter substrate binding protein [Belnapia mucosa]MBL6457680.1 tripartite tricarboxylate transporter substrate binding protein [Belnapia mucosa]
MAFRQPGRGRRLVRAALLLASLLVPASGAVAQAYPSRPIRLVVPFPAGAGPDQVARMIAQHMRDGFGQPVVVENRSGALGSIGAQEVARSAPDGYTLLMATNTTHAANVAMIRNLAYDPVADFAPVARVITTAMVLLVKPDFPARSLKEFVAHARGRELTAGYGSGAAQMSIAQLRSIGGIATTAVSYRGVPQAAGDVIAGFLSLSFADYAIALAQMQGGQLRGLGVTATTRSPLLPELPSLSEEMPGFDVTIWYGLVAPAGTPEAAVARLAEATGAWIALPETQSRLGGIGLQPAFLPPAEFAPFIRSEVQRWTANARAAGIEPE